MTPPVQLTMLAPPAGVRHDDGDTARAAAASQTPGKRETDRNRVLIAHYHHANGLDDFQLADIVGIAQTSCGVRRCGLVRNGLIEKTERRNLSPSGSPVIVWAITREGIDAARTLLADTG